MTFPKLHTRGNIPMNSSCVYVCLCVFFFVFLFESVCIDPVLSYVAKDCILTCLVSVGFCIDIHLLYYVILQDFMFMQRLVIEHIEV